MRSRDFDDVPIGNTQARRGDALPVGLVPGRVIGDLRSMLGILEELVERIGARNQSDDVD